MTTTVPSAKNGARPDDQGPPGRPPVRHPLRTNGSYRALWVGDLVSQFGSKITEFVLPLLLVTTLHASALQVGVVQTAYMAPFFLLPLIAGVWLDHRSKRPVMIFADLIRFALVLCVPVMTLLGALDLWHVYLIAFAVGSFTVLYDIAAAAYLPELLPAPQLPAANSLVTSNQAVGGTAGPGLSGWLVGLFGPAATLVVDALSYLTSATALMLMNHREQPRARTAERDLRRELVDGVHAVVRNPPIRAVSLHACVYNAGVAMMNLAFLIFFVRELQHSSGQFGLIMVAGGVGAVTGALVAPRLIRRFGLGRAFPYVLVFSTTAYFLLLTADGGSRDVLWCSLAYFLGTAGSSGGSVIAVTMRQRLTPAALYARMTATYRLFSFGALCVGSLTAGVLADTVGARATLWVVPFVLMASAVPVLGRAVLSLPRTD
ncbi:MFS transporter [Streptomyces sp. NPDC005438]|uniref:MFS transporter n=1 Tax=Streptomyces sp. NPDC005438 TaxID=3156880 RepID=UPI0033AF7F24